MSKNNYIMRCNFITQSWNSDSFASIIYQQVDVEFQPCASYVTRAWEESEMKTSCCQEFPVTGGDEGVYCSP